MADLVKPPPTGKPLDNRKDQSVDGLPASNAVLNVSKSTPTESHTSAPTDEQKSNDGKLGCTRLDQTPKLDVYDQEPTAEHRPVLSAST